MSTISIALPIAAVCEVAASSAAVIEGGRRGDAVEWAEQMLYATLFISLLAMAGGLAAALSS